MNTDPFLQPLSLSTCEPQCHQIPASCRLKAGGRVGTVPSHPSGDSLSGLGRPGFPCLALSWHPLMTGACPERLFGAPAMYRT